MYRYFKRIYSAVRYRFVRRKLNACGCNFSVGFPFYGHELQNVSIGDNFSAGERLKLRTFSAWRSQKFSPCIKIGNNVSIQTDCHISAINSVEIGDDVLMASFVYISDHSHGYCDERDVVPPPIIRNLSSKGGVKIGNKVWLGEKVTVLSGVSIGEGAIIGANAVVTRDIPPFSVAAGNPARIIKRLK